MVTSWPQLASHWSLGPAASGATTAIRGSRGLDPPGFHCPGMGIVPGSASNSGTGARSPRPGPGPGAFIHIILYRYILFDVMLMFRLKVIRLVVSEA